MKRVVLGALLAGALATNVFGGDFTHEVNYKSREGNGDGEKIEWTLLKGKFSLTDNIDFKADIDRDIYGDQKKNGKGSEKDAGWDTNFELQFKTSGFDFGDKHFDLTPTLGMEWDAIEFEGGEEDDYTTKENYYFSPRFAFTIGDVWFGIDPRFTSDNINKDTYLELRNQVDYSFALGEFKFNNWLELYHFIGGDESFGGTDESEGDSYVLDVENYFSVERDLFGNFSFWMEFGTEIYGIANDSDEGAEEDGVIYLEPRINYNINFGEENSFVPYAGFKYTQADITGADEYEDDNWTEAVVGFKVNVVM